MKIGLPKALLYYRYECMWKSFFEHLGCDVIVSGDTDRQIAEVGIGLSESECCLPLKVFLGHVSSLLGRCDYVLVPRFERLAQNEEFCVRFWGLPDIVRNTFPKAPLLTYNLQGHKAGNEVLGFMKMGELIGKGRIQSLRAYKYAQEAQRLADSRASETQRQALQSSGIKVLLAAQPYLIHDAYTGPPIVRMILKRGATPVFSDRCDRAACRSLSKQISSDLYWTINKEVIGAVPILNGQIDGVILITAFPCGTDSLVNELALRKIHDVPLAHIVLDGQEGEAGLETRIECFLDILEERRRYHAS